MYARWPPAIHERPRPSFFLFLRTCVLKGCIQSSRLHFRKYDELIIPVSLSIKIRQTPRLGLDILHQSRTTTHGVIPHNVTWSQWSTNILSEDPAGSYYSSSHDLQLIGRSILNPTLLSPALTCRWLKPVTFTGDNKAVARAPWEIYRAPVKKAVLLKLVIWIIVLGILS